MSKSSLTLVPTKIVSVHVRQAQVFLGLYSV